MTLPSNASSSPPENHQPDEPFFCSVAARESEETLPGSAPSGVKTWVLLEYHGAWPSSVLPESDLPWTARTALQRALDAHGAARFQFIRQAGPPPGRPSLFVVQSDLAEQNIQRIHLDDYEQLSTLDIPRLLSGNHPLLENYAQELFLVCVHGRRDLCCAKWGLPLYQALVEEAPAQVWQTTHLGGHRFAPTMVTLPHGLVYGWLEPRQAREIVTAHARGELFRLDLLRGRSALEPWEQAAEVSLRQRHHDLSISSITHVESRLQEPERWQVRLSGSKYTEQILLARETLDSGRYLSCGPKKFQPIIRFVPNGQS